ncbi:MAG TPA: N-acetyltransferase [Burkholderiaceae bacterium]|jgi:predicted GNAT family N-acyltransferase|nr:N-acetyltransferase [Burkholderiaceae bacterium]
MRYNLTLTEQLLRPIIPTDTPLWKNSWEVGRLVLAQEYRCGQDLLKHCLYHTLHYLCQNAEVGNLHASCSHVLSRLYRRFGFTVLEKNVLLEGTEKTYTLIHGHPPIVLTALNIQNTHEEQALAHA